jgi:hypothetical protein
MIRKAFWYLTDRFAKVPLWQIALFGIACGLGLAEAVKALR